MHIHASKTSTKLGGDAAFFRKNRKHVADQSMAKSSGFKSMESSRSTKCNEFSSSKATDGPKKSKSRRGYGRKKGSRILEKLTLTAVGTKAGGLTAKKKVFII